MTKVFLVTSGEYSDYGLDAVFSTKEKAELFIASFQKGSWSEMRIEEWQLDQHEIRRGMKAYFLRVDKDGHIYGVHEDNSAYGFDQFCGYAIDGSMFTHVFAEDEDHARKIAADRRKFILGTCGWGKIPPSQTA